ncbi:hypothetical protein EBZ80_19700 [bacterium]|nr:hypothetical protein [bacterium]
MSNYCFTDCVTTTGQNDGSYQVMMATMTTNARVTSVVNTAYCVACNPSWNNPSPVVTTGTDVTNTTLAFIEQPVCVEPITKTFAVSYEVLIQTNANGTVTYFSADFTSGSTPTPTVTTQVPTVWYLNFFPSPNQGVCTITTYDSSGVLWYLCTPANITASSPGGSSGTHSYLLEMTSVAPTGVTASTCWFMDAPYTSSTAPAFTTSGAPFPGLSGQPYQCYTGSASPIACSQPPFTVTTTTLVPNVSCATSCSTSSFCTQGFAAGMACLQSSVNANQMWVNAYYRLSSDWSSWNQWSNGFLNAVYPSITYATIPNQSLDDGGFTWQISQYYAAPPAIVEQGNPNTYKGYNFKVTFKNAQDQSETCDVAVNLPFPSAMWPTPACSTMDNVCVYPLCANYSYKSGSDGTTCSTSTISFFVTTPANDPLSVTINLSKSYPPSGTTVGYAYTGCTPLTTDCFACPSSNC